jgi:hypothetical protein
VEETLTSLEILLTEHGLPAPSASPTKQRLIGPLWARIVLTLGGVLLTPSGALLVAVGLLK